MISKYSKEIYLERELLLYKASHKWFKYLITKIRLFILRRD